MSEKLRIVQVSDEFFRTIYARRFDLDAPHVFTDSKGQHWADPAELRAWRSSQADGEAK